MTKVVINKCFGGFGLSYKAMMRYAEIRRENGEVFELYSYTTDYKNDKTEYKLYDGDKDAWVITYLTKPLKCDRGLPADSYFSPSSIERGDPVLVQVVEELG